MTNRLAAMAGLLLIASPILAQRDTGIYTQPIVPSLKELDRLNLDLAWKAYIPVDSRGDGIGTVQIIDNQIYVQTKSNILIVLSETTGEEVWRMTMPKRYQQVFPLSVNQDVVLVVNGPRVYLLDRSNGKFKYFIDLPSTVAAGLAADTQQCYVVLSNNKLISVGLQPEDVRLGQRVRPKVERPDAPTGIKLEPQTSSELSTIGNKSPSITLLQSLRPPFMHGTIDNTPSMAMLPTLQPPYRMETGNRSPSAGLLNNLAKLAELSEINSDDKPRILWELQTNRRVDEAPLMYGQFLIVAGADRSVFVCNKYAERNNQIRHEYLADGYLSAPIAQYGSDLYFCVADGNVYWMNVESFRNADVPVRHLSRYLAGFPIDRKPVTTDDSIYLAGTLAGLTRLDRTKFSKIWTNTEADRIFAVNPNVIYAGDKRGNLLILDKARGLKLATFDIRQFNFPIVNATDDRLFLAGHNGLLVCLHDRSFRRAESLRKKEPKPPADPRAEPKKEPEPMKEPPKKEAPPPPKKEADPKKDPDPKMN